MTLRDAGPLVLALAACGGGGPANPDARITADGAGSDAAEADAPSSDAGSPDASSPDAAPPDAEPARFCERVTVSTAGMQTGGLSYFGGSAGVRRYVSRDGRVVAMQSEGSLTPEDTDSILDIYVRDRPAATTTWVSVSTTGQPGATTSRAPSVSADGRYIAFHSASDTLVAGDTNNVEDIFVHDRVLHTTERVSVSSTGAQSNCISALPSISADGRYVAFESCVTGWAEVAGKTFPVHDIFVRDRMAGTTVLASPHPLGPPASQYDHHSGDAVISADGRKVAFESRSSTLADKNGASSSSEIFVRDLDTGTTEWISVHEIIPSQPIDSFHPSISGDGRFVAYESYETSQVAGDTNEDRDIFVRDRQTGTTERVNVGTAGEQAQEIGATSGQGSMTATISDDGRYVAFSSYANNLVAGDTNTQQDIFLRDRMLGTTVRVTGDAGAQPNAPSEGASMSGDGRWIGFVSGATNIVTPDDNGTGPDFYICPVD
jgi:Tol biopolymer transport system component